MITAKRIQRLRTSGWKKPDQTIYVGRPTKWGNPWIIVRDDGMWMVRHLTQDHIAGVFDRHDQARHSAVLMYWAHLEEHPELRQAAVTELAGYNLMCWCPPPEHGRADMCHAAVLLTIASYQMGGS